MDSKERPRSDRQSTFHHQVNQFHTWTRYKTMIGYACIYDQLYIESYAMEFETMRTSSHWWKFSGDGPGVWMVSIPAPRLGIDITSVINGFDDVVISLKPFATNKSADGEQSGGWLGYVIPSGGTFTPGNRLLRVTIGMNDDDAPDNAVNQPHWDRSLLTVPVYVRCDPDSTTTKARINAIEKAGNDRPVASLSSQRTAMEDSQVELGSWWGWHHSWCRSYVERSLVTAEHTPRTSCCWHSRS
jgi:hypothetical protein